MDYFDIGVREYAYRELFHNLPVYIFERKDLVLLYWLDMCMRRVVPEAPRIHVRERNVVHYGLNL